MSRCCGGGGQVDARGHHRDPWLVRKLRAAYDPFLGWAMRKPLVVAGAVVLGLAGAAAAYTWIGSTFMPSMDEGSPVLTIRKHPTVGVEETAAIDLRIQRDIMARVPEVRAIRARSGADELGIDPVGLNDTDMFIVLAPKEEWRGPDTAWLLDELRRVVVGIPGISYSLGQPIELRVQEMIIGARGDVVVKAFGPDLGELNRIAREVAAATRGVTGAADVYALRNEGMKYLTVKVDRFATGRFGLNASEVQRALRVWVDGVPAGVVLEGEVRTPLVVRGEGTLRRSVADLAQIRLTLPGGGSVALPHIAEIREEEGPVQVVREQGQRFATVLANMRGRDLVGFVDEARAAVAERVRMPPGYRLEWGGQFENQQRASARLAIVVPIAHATVFLLLYFTFGSLRQAALVFCNVPFAAIGGVIGLWLSGEFLSVPASVGFIALIGIAVLNGVVLVSYINRLIAEEGLPLRDAVMEGARRRMTPVVLTATIATFGLVPFLFAEAPGSEIQRPLAVVVIGGLVTATSLTLILLPILYDRFAVPQAEKRALEGRDAAAAPAAPAAAPVPTPAAERAPSGPPATQGAEMPAVPAGPQALGWAWGPPVGSHADAEGPAAEGARPESGMGWCRFRGTASPAPTRLPARRVHPRTSVAHCNADEEAPTMTLLEHHGHQRCASGDARRPDGARDTRAAVPDSPRGPPSGWRCSRLSSRRRFCPFRGHGAPEGRRWTWSWRTHERCSCRGSAAAGRGT